MKSKSIQDNQSLLGLPHWLKKDVEQSNDYGCGCPFKNGVQVHTCSNLPVTKSKSIQDKKIRVLEGTKFHEGLIEHSLTHSDKDKCSSCVEQSKEEQCGCNEELRMKCEEHYFGKPKTEDTGENKCANDNCKELRTSDTPYCQEHMDELVEIIQKKFIKQLTGGLETEDSHDTLSAPLNKDWSYRFDEKFVNNVFGFPKAEDIKSFISQEIESARVSERKAIVKEIEKIALGLVDESMERGDGYVIESDKFFERVDELLSKIEEKE